MEKWLPWVVVGAVALWIWKRMQSGQPVIPGLPEVAGPSGGALPVAGPTGGAAPVAAPTWGAPVIGGLLGASVVGSGDGGSVVSAATGGASISSAFGWGSSYGGLGGAPRPSGVVAAAVVPSAAAFAQKPIGLTPVAGPSGGSGPAVAGPTQAQLTALKPSSLGIGPAAVSSARDSFLGGGLSLRGSGGAPAVAGPTVTAARPTTSGRGGLL